MSIIIQRVEQMDTACRKQEIVDMKKWKKTGIVCLLGTALLYTGGMEVLAEEPGRPDPGWICLAGKWYWQKADMTAATGWLSAGGRTYYLREDGVMAVGFQKVGEEWYYFHEDGGMNLGELELDNAVYSFSAEGALTGASWKENTGGGAYFAGCYDAQEQSLFECLCDEKRDQYFDARPDRETEYDGDMRTAYDRYAGFKMDVRLNRIAAVRLRDAMEKGYGNQRIYGEGTIEEYLAEINYRKNSTCKEIYIRDCEDGEEAFDKIMELLEKQYGHGESYKDTLDYYRSLGISHCETDGRHWFMVVLMR